jgi:glycosyltransferase involved in cell wall biosynthesis
VSTQPKILHISTVHGHLDGRIYYKEVRSLRDAGYAVGLAGTVTQPMEHDGVRIIPLGSREGSRWRRPLRDLRALAVMLRHRRSILHIHDPELLVAAFLPSLLGHKVVYDVHEFYVERIADSEWIPRPLRRVMSALYDRIETLALKRFAGVVIVSEGMRARYRAIVGDERIALVRNFPRISQAEIAAARASSHPLGGTPYILHTGGAMKLRAFHTMVAAAEELRRRGCEWPIVNLGPVDLSSYGEDAADLLLRAAAADVRNIGRVSQEKAWSYVAHASIGYLPLIDVENNRRGMPNKLFENLMFGLPLVASDIGVVATIVTDAKAGLLAAAEDPRAHADALARLIDDPALRAAYAENAARSGGAFGFDGEFAQLCELYARINA